MAKVTFRTVLSDTKEFISESGSPYLDQYEFDFDEKGEVKRTTLHKSDDPINVYAKIQADFESCDINAIMRRFALGDSEALNVKQGIYADVTKMPKNIAELLTKVHECEKVFDGLDPEVKQLFNNSYEEFWYEYGSDEFDKKIAEYNDRFVIHDYDDVPESEVVDSNE